MLSAFHRRRGGTVIGRLEVVDAAGRVMLSRELGAPGAGRHELTLAPAPALRPGVYWVRVRQDQASAQAKLVVVR